MHRTLLLAVLGAATPALAQDVVDPTDTTEPAPDTPVDAAQPATEGVEADALDVERAPVDEIQDLSPSPPPDEPVLTPVEAANRRKKRKPGPITIGGETLKLDFGGALWYDLRFRPERYTYGTWYDPIPDPRIVARNEVNTKVRLGARLGRFGMKTDIDLGIRGYPKVDELADLPQYQEVSPFRFEFHEAYAYAQNVAPGLDIRIGQQKALFGVGDQFNPTNTINPNDFEDVLLFGDQVGNLMVRLDYSPAWNWQLTGILVPVFKPAVLPDTAYLGQSPDRYPFTDAQTRWNLGAERALLDGTFPGVPIGDAIIPLPSYPTVVRNVNVRLPEFNAENMQQFFRVAATLGGQDIALSYYRGFSDIPQPVRNDTYQNETERCLQASDLGRPAHERMGPCIAGLLETDVVLTYPKMHVLGFNMAGEMDLFGWLHDSFKPLGYRIEVGVFFPEHLRMEVVQHDVGILGFTEDGPYDFPGDADGTVLPSKPFAKWVVGLDYTFNKHLYMNTQWVHGFPDEFGAGDWFQPEDERYWQVRASDIRPGAQVGDCVQARLDGSRTTDGRACAREWLKPELGDYLVVGLDIKFAAQRGLLRLFTIWDLLGVWESTYENGERVLIHHSMFTPEGFSAVVYPDFRWNFGNGFELHAGALLQFGKPWTKFGAPENGGHQIWTRAKFSY